MVRRVCELDAVAAGALSFFSGPPEDRQAIADFDQPFAGGCVSHGEPYTKLCLAGHMDGAGFLWLSRGGFHSGYVLIVYRTLGNSLAWLAAEPDYTFFQKVRPTAQDVFTVDATPVRSKVRFLCETVLLDAIRSVLLESIPPSIWIARNWDPSRRFAARGSVLPAGEGRPPQRNGTH